MTMIPEIERIVRDIKNLKVQGSTDVSAAGVECLRIAASKSRAKNKGEFINQLRDLAERISKVRVTEPALRNALKYVIMKASLHEDFGSIKEYTVQVCKNYIHQIRDFIKEISEIGSEMIEDGDVILTHCHSDNVTGILIEAKRKGKRFRAIVTETRPMYQGLMTVKDLMNAGIEVTLCVDAAIGYVMKEVTKVLVGVDAILADGSIVNKIGTFPIAVMAKEFGVPFYVAGGTYKFDPDTVHGKKEPIENRDPSEVADPKKFPGVKIINPAFDVTPSKFVTGLITERGMTKPEWIREIAEDMV